MQTDTSSSSSTPTNTWGNHPILRGAGITFPARHVRVHFADHVSRQIAKIDELLADQSTSAEDRTLLQNVRDRWTAVPTKGGNNGGSAPRQDRPRRDAPPREPRHTDSAWSPEIAAWLALYRLDLPSPATRRDAAVAMETIRVLRRGDLTPPQTAALVRLEAAWTRPATWADIGVAVTRLDDLLRQGVMVEPSMSAVASDADVAARRTDVEDIIGASAGVDDIADGDPPAYLFTARDLSRLRAMVASWSHLSRRFDQGVTALPSGQRGRVKASR